MNKRFVFTASLALAADRGLRMHDCSAIPSFARRSIHSCFRPLVLLPASNACTQITSTGRLNATDSNPRLEMESEVELDPVLPQRDRLNRINHLVLRVNNTCKFSPIFETDDGEPIAESEEETICSCFPKFEPEVERLWLDPDGRLVFGLKEEDRSYLSTRRSCIVRSPLVEALGRVVIKTSNGKQNNAIQDMDYRTICTFFRDSQIFHCRKTSFKLPDGREVGRLKHKARGRLIRIEFTDVCDYDMKILIMAAAALYQRRDISTDAACDVRPARDQVQFKDLIVIPHEADKRQQDE